MKFWFFPDFPTCRAEDCDYGGIGQIIFAMEQMDQVTISAFLVLDFCRREVLFHSKRPGFLPHPTEKYWFTCLEESQSMREVNRAYLQFLHELPAEKRLRCILSGNARFSYGRHSKTVFQNVKPLRLDACGNAFLLLCSVTYPERPGDALDARLHLDDKHYLFRDRRWEEDPTALDEREKHVLRLSIQELTQKEIADKLCLSVDTIKKIKQKIFDKLGVDTLTEAIHTAENRRLM